MALEYLKGAPRAFKVLVAGALVENMAFGLVIPFLVLYLGTEMMISTPLVGVILAAYTIAGLPSTIIGGMLADRIGRRTVMLASLGFMSVAMMMYVFASSFETFLLVAIVDSFAGYMYMPAANAMLADVIPSEKRPHAYSTLRIAWNVGIVFGPVLGAIIIVAHSMKLLFVFGSIILACAFVMNFIFIRETKPEVTGEKITFRAVLSVRKDRAFMMLCIMTGVFWFFFSQWISVLPLYANLNIGISEAEFGILFAFSALMTIVLQLWVTSKMVNFRRSAVMMGGQLVAALGFSLIFYANDFNALLICIAIITVGEIIFMSIVSAVIADMAPEAKRGLYMGFSGLLQTLGQGIGFVFGMSLFDEISPTEYIWLIFGLIGAVTSVGYIVFARMVPKSINHPRKLGSPRSESLP